MPIIEETYFKVVCDECGEAFPEHDSGGFTLYDTEAEAILEAGDEGEVAADGKVVCPTCLYERGPEEAGS